MSAFSGEVTVTEGDWGDVEFRITKVGGDQRDYPFDGDTVWVLTEAEYLRLKRGDGDG